MISGLVLKYRKDTELGMSELLSPLSMSGKAVDSDSARRLVHGRGIPTNAGVYVGIVHACCRRSDQ
jgi:hypothetical protein